MRGGIKEEEKEGQWGKGGSRKIWKGKRRGKKRRKRKEEKKG